MAKFKDKQSKEMKQKIIDYVNEKERCTIPEIAEYLEDKGNHEMYVSGFVIWSGVSERFANVFLDAFSSNEIELDATNPMEYLICGYAVNMPPVTSRNCNKIKHRHKYWYPAVVVPKGKSTSPQPNRKKE